MTKNWKGWLLWAFVLYILIGIDYLLLGPWAFILAPFLAGGCAWMYFQKATPSWQEGLKIGIYFILFGLVLDLVFASYILFDATQTFADFFSSYKTWQNLIGIPLLLLGTSLAGHFKKK